MRKIFAAVLALTLCVAVPENAAAQTQKQESATVIKKTVTYIVGDTVIVIEETYDYLTGNFSRTVTKTTHPPVRP